MKCVTHQQVSKLLHNKFVVVLGDSIQRAVYKDIVVLLQRDNYLSLSQLKSKGEMSFEKDSLVEGGRKGHMTNGTEYREVRQFRSDHHLVRFYFLTKIYSRYVESVLEDFRHGLKPDVVVVNSCVWDVSRYSAKWVDEYKENLSRFFEELNSILPKDSLIMWNLTMPLGKRIRGGFLVPEIEHKALTLRHDIIEANFYSGTLADAHGLDVLDLHCRFRFSLQHRMKDGVHWNAVVHRHITTLLLQHVAQAWGVTLPCPTSAVEPSDSMDQSQACDTFSNNAVAWESAGGTGYSYPPPPDYFSSKAEYNGCDEQFYQDSLPTTAKCPVGYFSFEGQENASQVRRDQPVEPKKKVKIKYVPAYRPPLHAQRSVGNVLPGYGEQNSFKSANHHQYFHPPSSTPSPCPPPPAPPCLADNQYVMRNRHTKQHYAPYSRQRPSHHQHHSYRY
ncbi:PC-esterase domain-containing protein 1A-like [Aplochiton taeniatus]